MLLANHFLELRVAVIPTIMDDTGYEFPYNSDGPQPQLYCRIRFLSFKRMELCSGPRVVRFHEIFSSRLHTTEQRGILHVRYQLTGRVYGPSQFGACLLGLEMGMTSSPLVLQLPDPLHPNILPGQRGDQNRQSTHAGEGASERRRRRLFDR